MLRKIISINRKKCNGCGLCAKACHEGAIGMVDGKAWLLREDYCDGLGDCLPACPANAITFEEREAPAYNEAAVLAAKKRKQEPPVHACPGSALRSLAPLAADAADCPSQLRNFPIQLKLAPANAPFYQNANLLIAADCTAFAYGSFHRDFLQGRICLIGCPKLDAVNYAEKLTQLFRSNAIASVTLTRMEVPCCGGLVMAVKAAIAASGKEIPLQVTVISPSGELLK